MLVAGVELLPVFGHGAAAQAPGVLDLKGPEAPGGRVLTKPIRSSIPWGSGPGGRAMIFICRHAAETR